MALVTMKSFPYMLCMAEKDKVRHPIDRHPCDFLTLLRSGADFRYLRTVRLDRPVARETEVSRRDLRLVLLVDSSVAEVARKTRSIFSGMNPMAEGHWLRANRSGQSFLRPWRWCLLCPLPMHQP